MSGGIHFGSKARNPGSGTGTPGFEHGRLVAVKARANQGEWFDFRTGMVHKEAQSKVWHVQRKPSVAFRPPASFEWRVERRADGSAVQVRYIGDPS